MKKHSILALLLALVMALSLLSGCGSTSVPAAEDGSEKQEPSGSEDSASAVTADTDNLFVPEVNLPDSSAVEAEEMEPSYHIPIPEEPLTYTMWMTYAPFAADLVDVEHLKGLLVLDTLQEITNIHFDITAANGAAEQDNFNLMIAGGDCCDILSSMKYYNTGLEGAVEEGIIQDLADVIPEKCPIYWKEITSNTNTLMRAYTDSGYMPALIVVTPEVGQEVIGPVLRDDWLSEFGMDMPGTFDDLYEYLSRSLSEKNAPMLMTASDGLYGDFGMGLNINLGGYEVVNGQVEYGPAQPAFADYLKFMNKLYTDGLISQDFFATSNEDLSAKARGEFGMGTNSLLSVGANNTSDIMMNVTDENFHMAVMPYVSVDGNSGNHLGPDTLTDTMKDDDPWCFSTECDNIEPLLEMVEYMYSDEGFLLTNYGVEGESYYIDENGDPQYTDLVINNPDGLSYFFASYVYATNAASGFFPYINDQSKTFYDFNENQWEVFEDLKNLSDCAYNYPSYAALTTEENGEVASIESDLSTYMDSTVLEFIVGSRVIDAEFDSFVETLYDMGLQDILDIEQAAYDRAIVAILKVDTKDRIIHSRLVE